MSDLIVHEFTPRWCDPDYPAYLRHVRDETQRYITELNHRAPWNGPNLGSRTPEGVPLAIANALSYIGLSK